MHKAGAAQATIVLQSGAGSFDLPGAGLAAQLLGQFGDLGQACCAQGVALGQQATGGVDHIAATVAVVAVATTAVSTTASTATTAIAVAGHAGVDVCLESVCNIVPNSQD